MKKETLLKIEELIKKYSIKSLERVTSDKTFLKIETYKVELNNGEVIYRDKLIKNGGNGNACVIVPLVNDNQVLMVVQPRVFTHLGAQLDFPAGYLDDGEDHRLAAIRELLEETGYKANKMKEVAYYYQDEGVGNARNKVFIASELEKVCEVKLDEDEYLETILVDVEDIKELMELGYIASGGARIGYCELMLDKLGKEK
jgi:ADP-ribose pyrophosphatase